MVSGLLKLRCLPQVKKETTFVVGHLSYTDTIARLFLMVWIYPYLAAFELPVVLVRVALNP